VLLGIPSVDPDATPTLHVLLKYRADIEKARRRLLGMPARDEEPSGPAFSDEFVRRGDGPPA
jgi:hypothetical protein